MIIDAPPSALPPLLVLEATFPLMMLLLIVSVPVLAMPPPSEMVNKVLVTVLSLTVHRSTVSVPVL